MTGDSMRTRGFTLVEMLIAVSIFSVIAVVSMDIFIRAQRAQRAASALEKVQDVTRFIVTRMAQEFQTGHIDYGYYNTALGITISDAPITSETLALKNSDDTTLLFRKEENGICGNTDATSPCMTMVFDPRTAASPSGINQSERITPDGYTIQKLAFYITPGKDSLTVDMAGEPPLNDYPSDLQPRITIMMTVRGTVAGLREPITFPIQTTLSSREYVR